MRECFDSSIIPPAPWTGQGVRRLFLPLFFLVTLLPFSSEAWAYHHRSWNAFGNHSQYGCPTPPRRSFPKDYLGEHYSPEENLEAIDVAMIDRAKKSIDIAMYSFTDRAIADALIRAAKRGVTIRIYRDRIQVRDRGDKTGRLLDSRAGKEHISVMVKRNSSRNIMHLKAYVIDRTILRTGSANWSPPGEGAFCRKGYRSHRAQQDNNLVLTTDKKEILRFEATFSRIYQRGRNVRWSPEMKRKRD